jgi:hypothetical protein
MVAMSLALSDKKALKYILSHKGGIPDHPDCMSKVLFDCKVAFCIQVVHSFEEGPVQSKQEGSQGKQL